MINVLWFAIGIALLYWGGELLVRSAIKISSRLGISRLTIGLTVVALGTSLPELFVSMTAVIEGAPQIAVANIVGSNIINIALILPLIPLYMPLTIPNRLWRADYPMMIGTFVVLLLLIIDWRTVGVGGALRLSITAIDGALLLATLAAYLVYLVRGSRRAHIGGGAHIEGGASIDGRARIDGRASIDGRAHIEGGAHIDSRDSATSIRKTMIELLLIVFGGVLLAVGSDLLVTSAERIASALGVSKRILALTIVAHGTNLPEFFAAFAALRKKEQTIAFGNLIGSNIVNTLCIFGFVGLFPSLHIADGFVFIVDLVALIAISGYILAVFLFSMRKGAMLSRWHGGAMLIAYLGYFGWLLFAR